MATYTRGVANIALIVAVLAVSTSAPLIRWAAPAPPLTVAAARVIIAAILLHLVARRAVPLYLALPRRERVLIAFAGLLLGAHFGVWITSLYLTSTAASVALVATQPIFAALFARLLGDRVGRRAGAGIVVAAVGCAVLASGDLGQAGDALLGDALAIAGAATAAGYLLVGRALRVSLPLVPYLAMVNSFAAALLLVCGAIAQPPVLGFAAESYAAIALCAVIPSLLGHTLLNWSVRRTPAHLVTLGILGEPVGAALLTWLLFAEQPSVHAALGGGIILLGIAVGFGELRRRRVAPEG